MHTVIKIENEKGYFYSLRTGANIFTLYFPQAKAQTMTI